MHDPSSHHFDARSHSACIAKRPCSHPSRCNPRLWDRNYGSASLSTSWHQHRKISWISSCNESFQFLFLRSFFWHLNFKMARSELPSGRFSQQLHSTFNVLGSVKCISSSCRVEAHGFQLPQTALKLGLSEIRFKWNLWSKKCCKPLEIIYVDSGSFASSGPSCAKLSLSALKVCPFAAASAARLSRYSASCSATRRRRSSASETMAFRASSWQRVESKWTVCLFGLKVILCWSHLKARSKNGSHQTYRPRSLWMVEELLVVATAVQVHKPSPALLVAVAVDGSASVALPVALWMVVLLVLHPASCWLRVPKQQGPSFQVQLLRCWKCCSHWQVHSLQPAAPHSMLFWLQAVPSRRGRTHTSEQVAQHTHAAILTSSHHEKMWHISVQRRLKLKHAPRSAVGVELALVRKGSYPAFLTNWACRVSLELMNSKKYPSCPRLNGVFLERTTLLSAKLNGLVMGHQNQIWREPSMVLSNAPRWLYPTLLPRHLHRWVVQNASSRLELLSKPYLACSSPILKCCDSATHTAGWIFPQTATRTQTPRSARPSSLNGPVNVLDHGVKSWPQGVCKLPKPFLASLERPGPTCSPTGPWAMPIPARWPPPAPKDAPGANSRSSNRRRAPWAPHWNNGKQKKNNIKYLKHINFTSLYLTKSHD